MEKKLSRLRRAAKTRARIRFAVQQWIDAASPSNFLALNPEAMNKALSTQGQSLAAGMQQTIPEATDLNDEPESSEALLDRHELLGRLTLKFTPSAIFWSTRARDCAFGATDLTARFFHPCGSGPFPSSGLPSGSTTRPISASPTESSTIITATPSP